MKIKKFKKVRSKSTKKVKVKPPIKVDVTCGLYKEQKAIAVDAFSGNYRDICVISGRRGGKSYTEDRIATGLTLREEGVQVMWITPTHPQSKEAFDRISLMLNKANLKFTFNSASSDRYIQFDNGTLLLDEKGEPVIEDGRQKRLNNGSKMLFKSIDRVNNIRGYSPNYVIMDEMAYFKSGAFDVVIRAFGMTINGELKKEVNKKVFIGVSTFCGVDNDFYNFYENCKNNKDGKSVLHRLHYSMNPVIDLEFIAKMKDILPKAVFDQEYEGKLIKGSSLVFGDFEKNQNIKSYQTTYTDPYYYFGLDISSVGEDKTVLTVMNDKGEVVLIHENKTLAPLEQLNELIPIMKRFPNLSGYAEKNSNEMFCDELIESGINLMKWTTTQSSKQKLVSKIILGLNRNQVSIPTPELCPKLSSEMSQYMAVPSANKQISYGHPGDKHDDYVDSLMMANYYRVTRGNYMETPEIDYRSEIRASMIESLFMDEYDDDELIDWSIYK